MTTTPNTNPTETPRTDREKSPWCDERYEGDDVVPASFARTLERELSAAKLQAKEWRKCAEVAGNAAFLANEKWYRGSKNLLHDSHSISDKIRDSLRSINQLQTRYPK